MTTRDERTRRRRGSLSREQIVAAATEILDDGGEGALTFRALGARLATGSGAIHWHVEDKSDLLASATDEVIARATALPVEGADPTEAIRAVALGLFDAIEAHPWVGAQLAREPWRPALLEIYECVGGPLQALGIPERALSDCGATLVTFILGVAGQNAANARRAAGRSTDREAFLDDVATRWEALGPERYPFVHRVAAQLRVHDDRAQFLAGVDLILAGIRTLRATDDSS